MNYAESIRKAQQETQKPMQADRFEELVLLAVEIGKETERNDRLMRLRIVVNQVAIDLRLEGEEREKFNSFADYVHDLQSRRRNENQDRDFELGVQIHHRKEAENTAKANAPRITELRDEMRKLDMQGREEMGHDEDREDRMLAIRDELDTLRETSPFG